MFYRGVIEDNNDPDKLGRVKVRVFGIHSDSEEDISTNDLPWSEVAYSLSFGNISGVGISSIPKQGSWVWCFCDKDIDNFVVFASCVGIHKEKESGAFCDKDSKYPLDDRLNEPDINRLARGEKVSETEIEKSLKENQTKGVSTASSKTWDEPESKNSKAKYPYNNVLETEAGHTIQIDDTEGNERIHIYHKSGSYIEMREDGSVIIKSANDIYNISSGNFKESIASKSDTTINADQSVLVGGSLTESIGKDETKEISGQYDLSIGKSSSISISMSGLYECGAVNEIKGKIIKLN